MKYFAFQATMTILGVLFPPQFSFGQDAFDLVGPGKPVTQQIETPSGDKLEITIKSVDSKLDTVSNSTSRICTDGDECVCPVHGCKCDDSCPGGAVLEASIVGRTTETVGNRVNLIENGQVVAAFEGTSTPEKIAAWMAGESFEEITENHAWESGDEIPSQAVSRLPSPNGYWTTKTQCVNGFCRRVRVWVPLAGPQ